MNKKHEEYLNNPYKINGIVERMFTTKTDETLTVDPETGQYYTMKKVSQNKSTLHDGLVYAKLFQDSVGSLMGLSHPSLRIILYAMSVVRPLSETVILNAPDVCVVCGMAEKTFYNNIMELLDKRILSRKLGSSIEFWFDPNLFFNGNRIRVSDQRMSSLKG
jgi:hypothetical protein